MGYLVVDLRYFKGYTLNMEKLNPKKNPIVIKCQGADRLPLDAILEFQGKLKRLSPKNKERLLNSICSQGFIAPLFIWDHEGDNLILDGHQRLTTLIYMRQQGWDIPLIPVVYIEADSEQDAKEKLLHITSSYGEFNTKELTAWLETSSEDIKESIRLADKEMELWKEELEKELGEEFEFTEELHESHNYVVLYFDNEVDWQTAQAKLGITSKHGSDSKAGYVRKGIGRVIRGDEILDRIR